MPDPVPEMSRTCRALRAAVALLTLVAAPVVAQEAGIIRGTVTAVVDGAPLHGIHVRIAGSAVGVLTDRNGRYRLPAAAGRVPVLFFGMGYQAWQATVTVAARDSVTQDASLGPAVIVLPSTIVVTTASRTPERIVDAPAAVAVVDAVRAADASATAQLPQVLASLPGVFAPQNGINDYNVGARGFNSFLTRRVLVLQDGRDLAIPTLSAQEWSALSLPLEALGRVEFVRGPGSALYGANAFSGVLNIITPAPRDARGSMFAMGAGELGTLRADLLHASASTNGRWGWRVNAGYSQSDSWDRARTSLGALGREYASAIDTGRYAVVAPIPGYEVRPLIGQTKSGTPGLPGEASGTPDPLSSLYGSARVDFYRDNGSVLTAEAGTAEVRNQVTATGAGRSQIASASRPWGRVAWDAEGFNVMAYYSGRESGDQWSLASGMPQLDTDAIWHLEGQLNRPFAGTRGSWVAGASVRTVSIDSKGTFLSAADDDRRDQYASAFGQVRFALTPTWSVVGAARYDGSNLYTAQWSPKGALVWAPTPSQQVRFTWNQAFQTPNPVERFLEQPAGAPLDLLALEQGLRQSPLGPALAGVADGALFTNSAAVPVLAIGNRDLAVEKVRSIELGYKGPLAGRGVLTIDAYYSTLTDFVTNLMAGANPLYAPWTAPDAVPAEARAAVEGAVLGILGPGVTRLPDASTAYVLSLGNAGRATEWGGEVAVGYPLGERFTIEANAAYFRASVERGTFVPGDTLLPNSPRHMGNIALSYRRPGGTDATLSARLIESYSWRGGFYAGRVPSRQAIDLVAGHQLSPRLRVQLVATDLLDQRRYEAFGASVIGRRVLGRVVLKW
jgi:outer membrane receptor protein involved in Fe transport